jgi:hypothetical protein
MDKHIDVETEQVYINDQNNNQSSIIGEHLRGFSHNSMSQTQGRNVFTKISQNNTMVNNDINFELSYFNDIHTARMTLDSPLEIVNSQLLKGDMELQKNLMSKF